MKFVHFRVVVMIMLLGTTTWGEARQAPASEKSDESGAMQHPESPFTKYGLEERLERFLVFNTILPEPCTVGTGFGTIHTPRGCASRGGISLGPVTVPGSGSAVCCSFIASCTAQVSMIQVLQNVTTLQSAGDHDNFMCVYAIPRVVPATRRRRSILFNRQPAVESVDTCQLKVEVIIEYDPPMAGAPCVDYLRIQGSSTVANGFEICGSVNTTIYLSYGGSDSITLTFNTNGRKAHIARVTRIGCDQRNLLVPDHCLQELVPADGVSRMVTSFGFPGGMAFGSTIGAEQAYSICVRAPSTANGITWSECLPGAANRKSEFYLSSYFANMLGPGEDPMVDFRQNNMAVTGEACDFTSYVEVHGDARHCGARFSTDYTTAEGAGIRTNAKPFTLYVNTKLDVPANFPTTTSIMFPYSAATSADPCANVLGFPPHAVGFEDITPGTSCLDVPTSPETGHCLCMRAVGDWSMMPPMPNPNPRTGFCLQYTLD